MASGIMSTSTHNDSASDNGRSWSDQRLAKSCARCRQHKLACKPGSKGRYPCTKCEQMDADCVLVERARPVPGPTLSERMAKQENAMMALEEAMQGMQRDLASLVGQAKKPTTQPEKSPTQHGGEGGYGTINGMDEVFAPLFAQTSPSRSTSSTSNDVNRMILNHTDGSDVTNARGVNDARKYRNTLDSASHPSKRQRKNEISSYQEAFDIFVSKNLPALCFFDPQEIFKTPVDVKSRSDLLFWAIMAVGSREKDTLQEFHVAALGDTMHLLRRTLGGDGIGFWDLCGAMVYNRYLAPITPIGHLVDLAYSLDLDRTYSLMQKRGYPTIEDARKIRLWICILGQDLFHSSMNNRPPHYPYTSHALVQAKWLASSSFCRPNDRRLLATYEFEHLIHDLLVDEHNGKYSHIDWIEWEKITSDKCAQIDDWCRRWEPIAAAQSKPTESSSMLSTIKVNSNLAKFTVTSRPLRGVKSSADLTTANQRYVEESVRWARALCRLCATDFQPPAISFVGESTLFAFAWSANFIMKVITSLFILPDIQEIISEIEAVITNLSSIHHSTYAESLKTCLDFVRIFVAVDEHNQPQPSPFTFEVTQPDGSVDRNIPDLIVPTEPADMSRLSNFFSDTPRWDPTMTWWLPMAQTGDEWPWENSVEMG